MMSPGNPAARVGLGEKVQKRPCVNSSRNQAFGLRGRESQRILSKKRQNWNSKGSMTPQAMRKVEETVQREGGGGKAGGKLSVPPLQAS